GPAAERAERARCWPTTARDLLGLVARAQLGLGQSDGRLNGVQRPNDPVQLLLRLAALVRLAGSEVRPDSLAVLEVHPLTEVTDRHRRLAPIRYRATGQDGQSPTTADRVRGRHRSRVTAPAPAPSVGAPSECRSGMDPVRLRGRSPTSAPGPPHSASNSHRSAYALSRPLSGWLTSNPGRRTLGRIHPSSRSEADPAH